MYNIYNIILNNSVSDNQLNVVLSNEQSTYHQISGISKNT